MNNHMRLSVLFLLYVTAESSAMAQPCDGILSLAIDFTDGGTFTLHPSLDSSVVYSSLNCNVTMNRANGTDLTPPFNSTQTDCVSEIDIFVGDYGGSFVSDTDFRFEYSVYINNTHSCTITRSVTASWCNTNLYAWQNSTSSTFYVGQLNARTVSSGETCVIEILTANPVSTLIQTPCDATSYVTAMSLPSALSASSIFEYHLQILDSSTLDIICSTRRHTATTSACTNITSTSVMYHGDGSFDLSLGGTTSNSCNVVAATKSQQQKACNSTVAFNPSDFTADLSFGSKYTFVVRDVDTADVSIQNCATVVPVQPVECTGATLGISFDDTGRFTIYPKNVPGGIASSCDIIMTHYDLDEDLRVKAAGTSLSCIDSVTFDSSDTVSQSFGYGGTFAFSLIGYDANMDQSCASSNHIVTECSDPNGSTRATVSVQYTGDGDFIVSGTNFPTMDVSTKCQYEIVEFRDASLLANGATGPYRVDCDNFIEGVFINGATAGYSVNNFAFDYQYSFRRRVVEDTSPYTPICYSATTSVTPAKCQGTISNSPTDTFLARWHDTVDYFVSVRHVPSVNSSNTCQYSLIQGSARQVETVDCSALSNGPQTFSSGDFNDATVHALHFSFQVFVSGLQVCSTVGGQTLLSCSNSGTGESFGVGTDFNGNFYASIGNIGVIGANDKCRVDMIRINDAVLLSSGFVELAIPDCDGIIITSANYSSAINGGPLSTGSLIDFRVVRLDGSDNVLCYSPIRTLKYTACSGTSAIGWIDNDSSELVIVNENTPDVSSGTYTGSTCSVESLMMKDEWGRVPGTCASAVNRLTITNYAADKSYLFHVQVSASSPSIIHCASPTYTLVDQSCTGLTGGSAYDDTGNFEISLASQDSMGPTCEFLYLHNEDGGDVTPIVRVADCFSASFTESTNFSFDKQFKFKYRRVDDGVRETCSVQFPVTPSICKDSGVTPTTSTLWVSHTSDGDFTVRIRDPPAYVSGNGTCNYYMESSLETVQAATCTNNKAVLPDATSYNGVDTRSFRFAYFAPNSPHQFCTTTTLNYVRCSTATQVYGWYSGDGDFVLSTFNPPSLGTNGDKCRYEFLEYNGNTLNPTNGDFPYVDSVDCSEVGFVREASGTSFILGSSFSSPSAFEYRVRVVSSSGSDTTCYSAVTSGTTNVCSDASLTLFHFDLLRAVTIGVNRQSSASADCQVGLLNYAESTNTVTFRGTQYCSGSHTITWSDAGLSSAPASGGYYRFGFMQYNAFSGTQTCASPTVWIDDCNSSGEIAVQYDGIGNFTVQSKDPPSSGSCAIVLQDSASLTVLAESPDCGAYTFTEAETGEIFSLNHDYLFQQQIEPSSGFCESPQVLISTVQCQDPTNVATSLDIQWRADGSFSVTVTDYPDNVDSSQATVTLFEYSEYILETPVTQTGFGPMTFSTPTGTSFVPGTSSTFLFSVTDGNSPASTVCAITPTTQTFTLCSGGGSITLTKYPFSRILVMPTNMSASGEICVLRTFEWGSSNMANTYQTVDCSNPSLVAMSGVGTYSATLARYIDLVSDFENAQPVCVTAVATVSVTACSSSHQISLSDPSFNEIQVTYGNLETSRDCALFIKTWNSYSADSTETDVVYFEDTACGAGTTYDVTTSQVDSLVGSDPGFSLSGNYEIEFAEYTSLANPGDSLSMSPSCFSEIVTYTPTVDACDNSAVTFERIDGQSVRVSVDCVANYGYASVSLDSYSLDSGINAGTINQSLPIAKSLQSCTSGLVFDFSYNNAGDYPFYDDDTIEFTFHYYGSSSTASQGCQSTIPYVVETFPASSLPALSITTGPGDTPPYTFTVTKPIPFNGGTCTLTFDCGSGLVGSIPFLTCDTPLSELQYFMINDALDDTSQSIPFNTECSFSYTYATTQPTPSAALSPSQSAITLAITPPACKSSGGYLITLSARFSYDERIIVSISDFPAPGNFANTECDLFLLSWAGYALSSPVVVPCNVTGQYDYEFTQPTSDLSAPAFKYSRQSGTTYSYEVQMRLMDKSTNPNRYVCISDTLQYTADLCEIDSNNLMTVSLIKRPYGTIRVLIDSVPANVLSCQVYFPMWKQSQTYLVPSVIAPCESTDVDAGGLTFDYSNTGFEARAIGYASATPTVVSDAPLCAAATLIAINPSACAVSLTTSITGYDAVHVSASANVASGSKCVFYAYTWNGVDVHAAYKYKHTTDCITGVTFTSSDVTPQTFDYDSDYLFGYAVFSSTSADAFNSDPSCSYEPTLATDGLHATRPTCSTPLEIEWIDISKVSIDLSSAPAPYGKCIFSISGYADSSTMTCTDTYVYDYGSAIGGVSLDYSYKFYAKETGIDTTNDVVCTSTTQSVSVSAYDCSDTLTHVVESDNSNYQFSITNFTQTLGTCKLVISCTGQSASGEQTVSFSSCSTPLDLQFFEISDLFGGQLDASATCSFYYDYYAASSPPNNAFCRSNQGVDNLVIQPPDCLGDTSQTSISITTKYTVLGEFSAQVSEQPSSASGFACRIRMLTWAGAAVSSLGSTIYSIANCPTSLTSFTSNPSSFVYGSSYDFVVEQYKLSTNSLLCRSVSVTTVTTHECQTNALTTALSIHQLPFSRVQVSLTNPPSSDSTCAFYITTWNGLLVNTFTTSVLVPCNLGFAFSEPNNAEITSGSIGVFMVRFASTSASLSDEPICGTSVATVSPSECSEVPSSQVTDYGEITLTFGTPPVGKKCVFYVNEWANDSTSSVLQSASFESSDCSTAIIDSLSIGYSQTTFAYDSNYEFEYAQFDTSADITTDEPSCTKLGITDTAPTPTCTSSMNMNRVDGETISVTLWTPSGQPDMLYGACKVLITSYQAINSASATVVNVQSSPGSCVDGTVFTFTSTVAGFDLSDDSYVSYEYRYYGDITDLNSATCTSSTAGPSRIDSYDIGSLQIIESTGPLYSFSLTNTPTAGTCKVDLSCGVGKTGNFNFTCPTGSGSVDFPTLSTIVGYVASGTACTAILSYYTTYTSSVLYDITSAVSFTLTAPICPSTAISSTYTYDGAAHLTMSDLPSTDSVTACRVTVLSWADTDMNKYISNSCTSSVHITDELIAGSGNGPLFMFGTSYTFVVQQYSATTDDLIYCQSSPVEILSPSICSGGTASIIKYPFERIRMFATDTPSGYSKCVFYVTRWASTVGVTRTTNLVNCATGEILSSSDFSSQPFAYEATYSVRVSVYADGEVDSAVEPYCGINEVSIVPQECDYSLSFTNPAFNTIRTVIDSPGYTSGSCQFFSQTWNGNDISSTSWAQITKQISSTCGGVNFVGSSIGSGLGWGFGGTYNFEYAEYENPAPSDYSLMNPSCSISAVIYTSPSSQCVPGSSLVVTRNDGQTVFVTIASPHVYGTCVVELIEYNGVSESMISDALACDSKFYFTYAANGPTFAPGDTVKFKYTWYPDGSNSYCSSEQASSEQLGVLVCGSLTLIYDAPDYVYTLTFDMQPKGGSCMIYFSCDSGAKTGSVRVTDCSQTQVTSLNQLNAYVDDPLTMIIGLRSVCSFWYEYTTTTPDQLTCSSVPTDPGVTIQVGSVACRGTTKALTVATPSYRADGTWYMTITNPPTRYTNPDCRILITRWKGIAVRETYVSCDSVSSTTTIATPGSISAPSLVFGEEYSFLVQYVDPSNPIKRFCDCATRTVVPEVCRVYNSDSSPSISLRLMTYPFGSIGAGLSGLPSRSGKCNYYLQEWAGNPSTVTSGPVACNSAVALVDTTNPFAYDQQFTAMMIQFPGTDISVQPLCGLNPVTINPTACSSEYTPVFSHTSRSSVTVGFPVNAKPDGSLYDCFFYVSKWNGVSKSDPTNIFWKKSSACADVIIAPSDMGGLPATYGSLYGVEFGLVSRPSSSMGSSSPECNSEAFFDIVVDSRCDPSNLSYTRIDSNSIRIKLTNSQSGFTCIVTVLQDGSNSTPSSVTGPCSGNFDFHGTSSFVAANQVSAQFEILNGGTSICESNPEPVNYPKLSLHTLQAYTSGPSLSATVSGYSFYPTYTFVIGSPQPYHGTCKLKADCSGTWYEVTTWSSCSSSLTVDFTDINRGVQGTLTSGQSCSFLYAYTSVSGSETLTSSAITFGPLSIATCMGTSLTSLDIEYTATGSFSVTVLDPPNYGTSVCRVSMTKWNGDQVSVDSDGDCSDTFSFEKPAGAAAFTFGSQYSFGLSIVDQLDSYNTKLCVSSETSITPPLCKGKSSASSAVQLVLNAAKSTVKAELSDYPEDKYCYFIVSKWNGQAVSSYVTGTAIDCSSSIALSPGVALGYAGLNEVRAVAYTGPGSTTPFCGTVPISRTFSSCTGSITISVASAGNIQVTIDGEPRVGSRCVVYLQKWADVVESSSDIVSQTSSDCGSVIFSSANLGRTFEFGKTYGFNYAVFGSTKNTKTDNPTCSQVSTSDQQLDPHSCSNSFLEVSRQDPQSIYVGLGSNAPTYGICEFIVKSSASASTSLVQSGTCSAEYSFTSTDGIVNFEVGSQISVRYSYYAYGVVTGTPTCSSANDQITVPAFICCQSLSVDSPIVGTYQASIYTPAPYVGICQLILVGYESKPISWNSCASVLAVTFADILSLTQATTTDIPLGSTMTFKYLYFVSGSSSDGSTPYESETVDVTATIPVSIDQTPVSTTSIELSIDSLPSDLTSGSCYWTFHGCDGDTSSPTTSPLANCGVTQTFTHAQIVRGAVCGFQVTVLMSGSAGFAGDSGIVYFQPIGLPEWDVNQSSPMIAAGSSSNCLTVLWETPSETGGSDIQCYKVDRAISTSSSYNIPVVKCLGQSAKNLAPLYVDICNLSLGTIYKIQITVITGYGSASIEATDVRLEYLQGAPDSVYTSATLSSWPATLSASSSFPLVIVESRIGSSADTSTSRIFVSELINESEVSDTEKTLIRPVTGSTGIVGPLARNSPPVFRSVLSSSGSGLYSLPQLVSSPGSGRYSFVTHTLEAGGLRGTYWFDLTDQSGVADVDRKDHIIEFSRISKNMMVENAFRGFFARWTGFIEPEYTEPYVFTVYAGSPVRLFVDGKYLIDSFPRSSTTSCSAGCSKSIELSGSDRSGGLQTRKFTSIRLDMRASGPSTSWITLYWSSPRTQKEVIPSDRLFKSLLITDSLQDIKIEAGALSVANCEVEFPDEFIAGEYFSIIVTAKDGAGNVRSGQSVPDSFFATLASSGATYLSEPLNSGVANGKYKIPVYIANVGTYTIDISESQTFNSVGSSTSVTVVAGDANKIPSNVISVITEAQNRLAGSNIEIGFEVTDGEGNPVAFRNVKLQLIDLSATWTSDPVTFALIGVDETIRRQGRYGSVFHPSRIIWDGSRFVATIKLLHRGTYDLSLSYGNPPVSTTTTITGVTSSNTPVGANTVVIASSPLDITTLGSTPTLSAGTAYSFSVQLRDKYLNAITSSVSATVSVKLDKSGEGACTSANQPDGQYQCSITAEGAGTDLQLSLTVDGFQANVLSNGKLIPGPWKVSVASGGVDMSAATVLGLKSVYLVGVDVVTTIVLRDVEGNSLGSIPSGETYYVSGSFTDQSTTVNMVQSQVTDNGDGTFSFMMNCPSAFTGYSLSLNLVDGSSSSSTQISNTNFPSQVNCQIGPASPSVSTCQYPSGGTTSDPISIACNIVDGVNNALTYSATFVETHFVNSQSDNVYQHMMTSAGAFDASGNLPNADGEYDVYTLVGVRGGLIAQYYSDASFSSMLGAPLTDDRPSNSQQSPVVYTSVDSSVRQSALGFRVYDSNSSVRAYRWQGILTPPASDTFNFKITYKGSFNMAIRSLANTDIKLVTGSNSDPTNNDDTLTYEFSQALTVSTNVKITLEYVPNDDTLFSVTWTYSSSANPASFSAIPARFFQAPLRVTSTQLTTTITVLSSS